MNNKKNRKGFTIVELSIVIAVIAILAAVMIPTFANIIGNAQNAAAVNNAKAIYTDYVNSKVAPEEEGVDPSNYETNCWVEVEEGKYVEIKNGAAVGDPTETAPDASDKVICGICKDVIGDTHDCEWD